MLHLSALDLTITTLDNYNMAVQKPSIPKGTRDFSPAEMACRNYIFDTVKSIFKKYGYAPLETPAMENLTTLLGKYGDEGDKLLFKILNSGEAFAGVDAEELSHSNALSLKVCEKGLRYDLTVPFARYVVQHQNEITVPFKRFQIQPVWRADRPQKGRYREFYQCDVDVIGSQSQINELELVQIADEVFRKLDINVCIKINNRKVLQGLAEIIGHPDKLVDITVAIDKIDKIGLQAVKEELAERGIDSDGIAAYNSDKSQLLNTVSLGIDLPTAEQMNVVLYESKYHDSGFYERGTELPSTGGAGTVPYTMGGSLLLTGAAFLLLYNHTKRRKEDSSSS